MNDKAAGYSIWVVPEGEARDSLKKIMDNLCSAFGMYSMKSPKFEPHVTLIGGMKGHEKDIVEKTKGLADKTAPLPVVLWDVAYENEFFKAIYLRANPAGRLVEANRIARKIFRMKNVPEYRPHLSLVYGDYNAGTKQSMISVFIDKYIRLDDTPHGPTMPADPPYETFTAGKLQLHKTEGTVEQWEKIGEFELRGPKSETQSEEESIIERELLHSR